jgi:hypothetical protein
MISFRSFRKNISETHNFDDFLISEMAVAHHVRRTHHANIDEEDLDFLHQFPIEYWAPAKHQRYQFLWEELKKLHDHRIDNIKIKEIETEVASGLTEFVKKGKMPDELEKLFNEKKINNKYKDYWAKRIGEKGDEAFSKRDIKLEAERIAHDYAKRITEHLLENDLDQKLEFKLRGHSNKEEVKKFIARPYLNRLYHKIETTPGEEFNIESGLINQTTDEPKFKSVGSKGKHGLDLRNPEVIEGDNGEKKYVTSGWVMPKGQSVRSNLHDYLKYNAAGIFGDMPGMHGEILPGNVFYKRIDSIDDKFAADARKKSLIKKHRDEIRNENLTKSTKDTTNQIEKKARERANEDLVKEAEQGMLYAEPIPVHKGERPIPKEERRIKVEYKKDANGNLKKTLVYPPIYLPFKKIGNREIPLIKPGFHFRELGTKPEDFDETGEVSEKIKDKLIGHNKNYVISSEKEYLKNPKNIIGSGDLYNAQQQDSQFLSQSNHEYEKKYKLVFPEGEKKVGIKWNGKYWEETPNGDFNISILNGIFKCIKSSACGGKSSNEQTYLMNHIEDLYQDMFSMMLENLDNPNLYTEKGRAKWVFTKVSNKLQKDLGAGTRRKRGKEAKSVDAGEVDTFTDSDVKQDGRSKNKGSMDVVVGRPEASKNRRRGEKDLVRLGRDKQEKEAEEAQEERAEEIISKFNELEDSNNWEKDLRILANTLAIMKEKKSTTESVRLLVQFEQKLINHIKEVLKEYGQEEKDADQNSFNIFKSLEKKSRNTADLIDIFFDYDLIKKTTNPKTFKLDKKEDLPEFKIFNDIKSQINFKKSSEAEDLIKKSSLEKDEKERLNIYLNTELDKKEEELKANAESNPEARSIPTMKGLSRRAGKNVLTTPEEKSTQKKPSEDWLDDVKSKDYRTLRDDPISLSHHPDYLSRNTFKGIEDKNNTLVTLEKFKENPYYNSAREHILNSLYKTPIEDEDEGEEQYEDLPIEGEGEGEEQYEAPPVTQAATISKPVTQVEPPVTQDKPVSKPVTQVEPPVIQDKPVSKPVTQVEPPVIQDKPVSKPVTQVEPPVIQDKPTGKPFRSKNLHFGTERIRTNKDDEDDDIGF